jgi:hypothetical protein
MYIEFIKANLHKYFTCNVDLAYMDYEINEELEADEVAVTIPVEILMDKIDEAFLLEKGYLHIEPKRTWSNSLHVFFICIKNLICLTL